MQSKKTKHKTKQNKKGNEIREEKEEREEKDEREEKEAAPETNEKENEKANQMQIDTINIERQNPTQIITLSEKILPLMVKLYNWLKVNQSPLNDFGSQTSIAKLTNASYRCNIEGFFFVFFCFLSDSVFVSFYYKHHKTSFFDTKHKTKPTNK